mmetsp:Transcript_11895/g.21760  ORF Transcript_11895/g.21760 Transcript_11895/m.21760 type:complete len:279 (-) Transcript_11895:66-902(-)
MTDQANDDLKIKIAEYKAREKVYLAGLLEQEAEMQRLKCTTSHVLGAYGDISKAAVRGALGDCSANMEVLLLRQKARERDREISDLKDRLQSNEFDQRSTSGQSLMRKCRALLEENRELGEQIREDRVSQLRSALLAERKENGELLQRCNELADFCKELRQENEKLQGTVSKVASRLREAKTERDSLQNEYREVRAKRRKEKDKTKTSQVTAPAENAPAESDLAPPMAAALDISLPAAAELVGDTENGLADGKQPATPQDEAPAEEKKRKKRKRKTEG